MKRFFFCVCVAALTAKRDVEVVAGGRRSFELQRAERHQEGRRQADADHQTRFLHGVAGVVGVGRWREVACPSATWTSRRLHAALGPPPVHTPAAMRRPLTKETQTKINDSIEFPRYDPFGNLIFAGQH